MIIAIDGPAGAGKSTTARAVARALGYVYFDTGAMYRAIALAFLRSGTPTDDLLAVERLVGLRLSVESTDTGARIALDGEDVTELIRGPDVTRASSEVSALPSVRKFLVEEQRRLAERLLQDGSGIVMEGRDIGTVVFPEAGLKIFLTASPQIRARRRVDEYRRSGRPVDEVDIRGSMEKRDRDDSARAVAPMRIADDAELLDTSSLSFEEQVGQIVKLARERGA